MSKQEDISVTKDFGANNYDGSIANQDLMADAGKVTIDPAEPWGRGLWIDAKRTIGTHWWKEMKNFNQKTVGVTLLMFISIIAPTLAFGAAYSKASGNYIGAIETILATAYMGMFMALFSGMPLIVVGSTGPMLAIGTAVYDLAGSLDVPVLTFNAWVSIWLLIYVVICVFFDLTRYVKLATRFTDDIFAFLIVTIFVLDAIGDPFSNSGLTRYLDPNHPSHADYTMDPNYNFWATGFLSVILGLGTTWSIFFLRGFKTSSFFPNSLCREALFDFAVILSVVTFCCVDKLIFNEVQTDELNVPDRFEPTFQCCTSDCVSFFPDDCPDVTQSAGTRKWFVNLGNLNGKGWAAFAAAGPAILVFLGVYLDNGITWHLIVNPNHKLQSGEAYNYDLLLNGIVNTISGLIGCPWLVASTVPCITHLNALAARDKDNRIQYVQETRLTGFLAHLILLCFIFALQALKLIPVPVLLGVFLFMGLSALPNIQFWQRIQQFFKQPSLHDETPYNKYMSKWRVHQFTLWQLLFFGGVFVVQNIKTISIGFPFMTLLCIPGRLFLLPRFFEGWELELLDGEDTHIDAWVALKEARRKSVMFGAAGDDSDDDMPSAPKMLDATDDSDAESPARFDSHRTVEA